MGDRKMEFWWSNTLLGLALVLCASDSWAQQLMEKGNGTYDVQTIKEVTSATKIAQVCLEDIEAKTGVVTQKDFRVCDCVILELMDSISYREYWEIEQNILYGRDWKGTEAMRRTRPQLVEACDWPG
jgi:hypothetical protein|tara:strand:+ start:7551 stop:7931 length:381 start_codon:yes stop_codon:yes gene_type:complete